MDPRTLAVPERSHGVVVVSVPSSEFWVEMIDVNRRQLVTSIVQFPFDVVHVVNYPMSTVNLYVPRTDVTFDEFRVCLRFFARSLVAHYIGAARYATQSCSFRDCPPSARRRSPPEYTGATYSLMRSFRHLLLRASPWSVLVTPINNRLPIHADYS